jgi:hypothetical protein
MRKSLHTLVYRTGLALGSVVVLAASAGAQVSATFYPTFTGSTDPNSPFQGGGTPLCSVSNFGGYTGFSMNFADPSLRAAVCPSNPNALNPAIRTFAVRITGSLYVDVAGTYDLGFSADDGDALAVNGNLFDYEWTNVKGGGPGDVFVDLNAGKNDFVIDYNNSFQGGGFVRFNSNNTGVQFTAPEPSSIVLMAAGLFGVAAMGVRRRRKA